MINCIQFFGMFDKHFIVLYKLYGLIHTVLKIIDNLMNDTLKCLILKFWLPICSLWLLMILFIAVYFWSSSSTTEPRVLFTVLNYLSCWSRLLVSSFICWISSSRGPISLFNSFILWSKTNLNFSSSWDRFLSS